MKWTEDLRIGCEKVDIQHQELCHMVLQLEQNSGTGISEAMKFIVDYTRHHFSEEEKLMQNISYPGFESHKILHNELIEKVISFLQQLKAGKLIKKEDLLVFLNDWIKDHIIQEDKKIGIFFKGTLLNEQQNAMCRSCLNAKEALEIKVKLLRELFQKKKISAEDVKQKKLNLFISRGKELGLDKLRYFIEELDHLISIDFIGNNEKKLALTGFLEKNDYQEALSKLKIVEDRLFYLRTLHSLNLIDSENHEKLKLVALPGA